MSIALCERHFKPFVLRRLVVHHLSEPHNGILAPPVPLCPHKLTWSNEGTQFDRIRCTVIEECALGGPRYSQTYTPRRFPYGSFAVAMHSYIPVNQKCAWQRITKLPLALISGQACLERKDSEW